MTKAVTAPNAKTVAEPGLLDAARQAAVIARLVGAGVRVPRPETCVIDADVVVGPDTVIEPFAQLLGRTRVGSGCLIRSFAVIENCTLGNGVLILQSSVLEDSTVADGAPLPITLSE